VNSGPSAYKFLHSWAAHQSNFDLCHHHAVCTDFIIFYSAFLRLGFLGFASAAAAVVFLDEARFMRALILLRLRETPNDPAVRLPFLVFLSPLPIKIKYLEGQV
jgi:hypothetical protein